MTPSHVIGRQVLTLEFEDGCDSYVVQERVAAAFQDHVVPAMSAVFDRFADQKLVIRIDRLDIDVGRVDVDELGEQLSTQVCEAIEAGIAAHLSASSPTQRPEGRLTQAEECLSLWHYVLLRGHLPWWAGPSEVGDLDRRVQQVLDSLSDIPPSTRDLLQSNRDTVQRMALQASAPLLMRIVELTDRALAALVQAVAETLLAGLENRPALRGRTVALRRSLWAAALEESLRPMSGTIETRALEVLRRGLRAVDISGATRRELRSNLRDLAAGTNDSTGQGVNERAVVLALRELCADAVDEMGAQPVAVYGAAGARNPSSDREAAATPANGISRVIPSVRQDGAAAGTPPLNEVRAATTVAESSAAGDSATALAAASSVHPPTSVGDPTAKPHDAIYLADAGLVLLHPFLAAHFEKLGLWRRTGFVGARGLHRAVHQLGLLATGRDELPEYALVLPKILCGLMPSVPIARAEQATERMRSEGDKLLSAVIRHWGALGSSSPEGLREAFLCREGRLILEDDGWRLRVAAKSYDVLLDRVPWPLSIVRLPWMPKMLRVDWM